MGVAGPYSRAEPEPVNTPFTQLYTIHQSLLAALLVLALLSVADPGHRASGTVFVPLWASIIALRRRFHHMHDQAYAERIFTRGWLSFVAVAAVAYVLHSNTSTREPHVLSNRGLALHGVASVWVVCFMQVMVTTLAARLAVGAAMLIGIALTPNPKYNSMVKVASWRRHSWPPRALPAASEGLGLLSALVRRDRTSQMSPGGRGHGATPRPSNRFRRV